MLNAICMAACACTSQRQHDALSDSMAIRQLKCCRSDIPCVQVFEMFYNFLVDSEAQQGASLYTLQGLLNSAANASLLLLNGDVSYARHAPGDRAPT